MLTSRFIIQRSLGSLCLVPVHLRSLFADPGIWSPGHTARLGRKREICNTLRRFLASHVTTMSESVPEGVLLGIGNPLLDITVSANDKFLEKYGLEANNAIIAQEEHIAMFDEMMRDFNPIYEAGGATQNSIRVAQWLLGKKHATTFFGCVGKDEKGEILKKKGQASGVNVCYQITDKVPTGVCGSVITDENRSLVAHLGAANYFSHHYLEQPEQWKFVEQAKIFYIGGFVFPVCNQAIFDIAKHAAEKDKVLAMNLSATFLCKYFADKNNDITPYIDVLFGNETEAAQFCKLRGIEANSIEEMALEVAKLPKLNAKRDRIIVFTQGRDPTVIATGSSVSTHNILPVDKADIKDTNGCGDAFVGGFLAQMVLGADIDRMLHCGQYAAREVIKQWGCNFPAKPQFE